MKNLGKYTFKLATLNEIRESFQDPDGTYLDSITRNLGTPGFLAFSVWGEEDLLLVAGFLEIKPGVWEVWMFPSALFYEGISASFVKWLSKELDSVAKENKLRRIQACVQNGLLSAERFLLSLDFSYEGFFKKWGSEGEDCLFYAKTYGD